MTRIAKPAALAAAAIAGISLVAGHPGSAVLWALAALCFAAEAQWRRQ